MFKRDDLLISAAEGGRLRISIDDTYWIAPRMRTGVYEPELEALLRRSLRSDSAFVDCRANVGYWSVLGCGLIRTFRRVVALEASPSTAALLMENARLNSGLLRDVRRSRVVETREIVEFAVDPFDIRGRAPSHKMALALRGKGSTSQSVDTIAIDDVVERYVEDPLTVTVLKVDVEGAERRVIEGAQRALAGDVLN